MQPTETRPHEIADKNSVRYNHVEEPTLSLEPSPPYSITLKERLAFQILGGGWRVRLAYRDSLYQPINLLRPNVI